MAVAIAIAAVAASRAAVPSGSNIDGKSTVEQRIVRAGPDTTFDVLTTGPGEPYIVRHDVAQPQSGREHRRRSLLYFAQLTDFQLADEESPARVEGLDTAANPAPVDAAWRPWEALMPHVVDRAIHQVNRFVPASPVAQGDGARARMAFAITTGDSADNMQRNETEWVRTLLEGGPLNPNSGTNDANPLCPTTTEGSTPKYTGVQDYNDAPASPDFYDPNLPMGTFAAWPNYPGLMDRAEQPFTAMGLEVPSYVAFGNHDGLEQGNQAGNRAFEDVATGCIKPLEAGVDLRTALLNLGDPNFIPALVAGDPSKFMRVPPDVNRQLVSKKQYVDIHKSGRQHDGHGFGFVDPSEAAAAGGAVGYYAWDPAPGFRFIAMDTISEGGVTGPSANGNVDDPQYHWVERQLQQAQAQDKLIVVFSHHQKRTLNASIPDEAAPPCSSPDLHGHDQNPGCDLDPRSSQPLHLGDDMEALFKRYPHVVAWVAGHTHDNKLAASPTSSGSGYWEITTAAEADWPQQNRLIEIMDNRDGTLSIFGTILDHSGPTAIPASGLNASGFSTDQLAAIGRTFSFNDTQTGSPHGEGTATDRNVELLVRDPRRSTAHGTFGGVTGGASGTCRDRLAPRSTIFKRSLRAGLGGLDVSGTSRDRGCATAGTSRVGAVSRVEVAVARRVRGRCRFLRSNGTFTGRRLCSRRVLLRASSSYARRLGATSWRLRRLRPALRPGSYVITARGIDVKGNVESAPRFQRTASLTLR